MSDTLCSDRQIEQGLDSGDNPEVLLRTVFIGGISLKSTPQDIIDYASLFDDVDSVALPQSTKTQHLKGYAKVTMKTFEGAQRILSVSNHTIDGLTVGVSKWTTNDEYLKTKEELSSRKVYVKFKERVGVKNVETYFAKFGLIQQFDIKRHPLTGRFRDFSYIIYEQAEAARAASANLIHTINNEPVRCEPCKPNIRDPKLQVQEENQDQSALKIENVSLVQDAALGGNLQGHLNTEHISRERSSLKNFDLGSKPLLNSMGSPTPIASDLSQIQIKSDSTDKDRTTFSSAPRLKSTKFFQDVERGRLCQPNRFEPVFETRPELQRPTSKQYFDHFRASINANHTLPGNLQFTVLWPNSSAKLFL